MDFLKHTIFAEKLEIQPENERVPKHFIPLSFIDATIGIDGPDSRLWAQMFILTIIHATSIAISSILAYYLIVKQRGTTTAFMVGYGILCPFFLYLPFYLVEQFDLRNPVLALSAASIPALQLFRIWESIHGTVPEFAEERLGMFMMYFPASAMLEYDRESGKPLRISTLALLEKLGALVVQFVATTALYSIMLPFDYYPFPRREIKSPMDLYYWGNLSNNYLLGALMKVTMEYGLTITGFLTSLFSGYKTGSINIYPLTASTSVADFWGRRWNTLVSGSLKRGVFKPIRKLGYSRPVGALAVFIVSGLMHEYLLTLTAYNGTSTLTKDVGHYMPFSGSHLMFFVGNAILLVLDGLLRGRPFFRFLEKHLPAPIRTAVILTMVLPLVSLFTDDYISLGLFAGFSNGFPRFWLLPNQPR